MDIPGSTAEDLLEQARAIWVAAVSGIDPERLVRESVSRDGDVVRIRGESFDLGKAGRIFLIAFGKAARGMAGALAGILGKDLAEGLVVTPTASDSPDGEAGTEGRRQEFLRHDTKSRDFEMSGLAQPELPNVEQLEAAHPIPDGRSVEAARRAMAIASKAGEGDIVFVCISGGGSALLSLPAEGISLGEKRAVTAGLLKSGADIRELNVVRKHLSGIKGGRLAKAAAPATIVPLVISDVAGDDFETIASGPAHRDSSTFEEAREVLARHGLWDSAPASVRAHIEKGVRGEVEETLKEGDPALARVHPFVVGNNLAALRAARREAERLGFETFILTSSDEGEARQAAKNYVSFIAELACSTRAAPRPLCLLAGGELTVTVRGKGRGGRNTEFVLAALLEFSKDEIARALGPSCGMAGGGDRGLDWLVASIGTDGIDGPTEAAGAWGDASTMGRARKLGLDPDAFLEDNDSYSLFERTGNLIRTGPTGTNVMDVRVFLLLPA